YSFQGGASSLDEIVDWAKKLGYPALALTDHDNLCGAMEYARLAQSLELQPIIGVEITLHEGYHLTLLARNQKGYNNLCRLVSFSHIGSERRYPELDPDLLSEHTEGLIALSGCPRGQIPTLISQGRIQEARNLAKQYMEWFGPENFFIELQQNLVYGDTPRVKGLLDLAQGLGGNVVATNNVHYHVRERHRLQDALVAIKSCKSLEESHRERRPNSEFHLKAAEEMAHLFDGVPQAIENTVRIAERCSFDLTRDLNYRFPDAPVPEGYTPETYLEYLCYQAAHRRYGSVTSKVKTRLQEEFRLIRKHNLAGFFLIYHEIIKLAHEVMIDLGLANPEVPLEENPPGRGRGSSVSMLVGYLIGLSHIDPLKYDLTLERFLPEEMATVPDIDLDFPRNIREELILRVHKKWGWDHAALSGMIDTYLIKGAIRDLGKALGLPEQEVALLAKRVDNGGADTLKGQMHDLPEFRNRVNAPGWRDVIDLASQLNGFPKYLAQHPGGMIISSTPLIDLVPVQRGAIDGRYICQWDKNSIDDASFVKIDFLALGTLSQMQRAIRLIQERTGTFVDLSRIDFDDPKVYGMIHRADTIGVFQVESAAQMQTVTRIRPRNLVDMAHEVGAVRPGVGVNDGVTHYIARRLKKEPITYDHPLEERALERTLGIILFQDQVNQLAIDVAGFSGVEADQLRRAFLRKNNKKLIEDYWRRFKAGAMERGVSEREAEAIFKKFNGHYMFPESHAFAFGATAYHMAWLKYYYPLEFSVAIFNQQPMGFYNRETLKEDAKRHGIAVLNPDINDSIEKCTIKDESLLLGFLQVRGVGEAAAAAIVRARDQGKEKSGPFTSLADAMERTGLQREAIENLVNAGAFDSLTADRRAALWEVGLRYRPGGYQQALPLPVEQDMPGLPPQSQWEVMAGEYRTMGVYPKGHLMAMLREYLPSRVSSSQDILDLPDGTEVTVAGLVIRRQRPLAKAVFLTLEDEFGHTPLVVWPQTYEKYRLVLREPVLVVRGEVSRRDGTMNVLVKHVESANSPKYLPKSKNWG
ncbi:MAG: DNA polymerase III subunit alpha, partial [Chloroflexi bacterium]|nr:DNA polymerase III subunit alpha [Chloroflexota bacterium]